MCKTGELISSLQTIQIPVQKSWICRRFLFIKSLVGIDSHIDSQLLGYVHISFFDIPRQKPKESVIGLPPLNFGTKRNSIVGSQI